MTDRESAKRSTAYQALLKISLIYKLDEGLKALTAEERLSERQKTIKPLVEEYFAWVKSVLKSQLPKGKTAEGLKYCINQEKYLRFFWKPVKSPLIIPHRNAPSGRSVSGKRTGC